jgi:hypothetical protein
MDFNRKNKPIVDLVDCDGFRMSISQPWLSGMVSEGSRLELPGEESSRAEGNSRIMDLEMPRGRLP